MDQKHQEKRLAEIHARGQAELPPEVSKSVDEALADSDEGVTVEEIERMRKVREYSGSLTLRIPKELHRQLALDAKRNGVSLNQYALYKLSRS